MPDLSDLMSAVSSTLIINPALYFKVKRMDDGRTLYACARPNNITESKSANYTDVPILGRSSPFKSYMGSSARMIRMHMVFVVMPEPLMPLRTTFALKENLKFLMEITYPNYSKNVIEPPPVCEVTIGNNLTFYGVCKSTAISYEDIAPWDVITKLIMYATAHITFEETQTEELWHKEHASVKAKLGGFFDNPLASFL